MKAIGLHLRIETTLSAVAERAIAMQLPVFQFFLSSQDDYSSLITIDDFLINQFREWRKNYFSGLYVHGSYGSNLSGLHRGGLTLMKRELELARQLSCTHLVMHPGSAVGGSDRMEGIDALAYRINKVMRFERDILLVLENTTHAKLTVGSDLEDFYHIRQRLDFPERVVFCVDTAHAFCYGYDITNDAERERFIALVDETMGIANVAMIHLNDASQPCGSRIDKHAIIGTGLIGESVLKKFACDSRLASIPLILELPMVTTQAEYEALQRVRSWFL